MQNWLSSLLSDLNLGAGDVYSAMAISFAALLVIGCMGAYLVLQLPKDYFINPKDTPAKGSTSPFIRGVLIVLKNCLGVALVAAGIVMIVMPGPGFVVILVGIILLDFPGKNKLVRKIIAQEKLRRPLNRLRNAFGKASFSTT